MYAVCQGAMAVECREGDDKIQNLLNCLQNYDSTITCLAERAFLKTLVLVIFCPNLKMKNTSPFRSAWLKSKQTKIAKCFR